MAVFLLIRHGHNDMIGEKLAGRLPDVHLNLEGVEQAKRLALEFKDLPIKAVYASPLERAVETAQPIADAHDLRVEILPALIEIDFGEWEGENLEKLKQGRFWKHVQGSPGDFRFPGGENFLEAQYKKRRIGGYKLTRKRIVGKLVVIFILISIVHVKFMREPFFEFIWDEYHDE